jgi:hypothetical protein
MHITVCLVETTTVHGFGGEEGAGRRRGERESALTLAPALAATEHAPDVEAATGRG